MHIFSSPRNKSKVQETARLPRQCQSTNSLSTTPVERKRFTVLLPQSVKTLFSKRASLSSVPPPPQPSSLLPRQIQQHLYAPEKKKTSREPRDNEIRPVAARPASAASTNVLRAVTSAHLPNASNTFPGRGHNSVYLPVAQPCEDDGASNETTGFSDRYSQARAKALAETVRRLQQTRSPSPLTPSSVSTGKTLPCFPEEAEYEEEEDEEDKDVDNYRHHYRQQQHSGSATGEPDGNAAKQATQSRFSCVESRAGTFIASAISATSLQTLAAGRSRSTSMVIDTSSSRSSSISSINSSAKSSGSSSNSTLSPTANTATSSTRPQSVLNASNETLTRTLPGTPLLEPAQTNTSTNKQEATDCSVQQAVKLLKPDNAVKTNTEPSKPPAQESNRQQRYSVAMSQNLSRRFQTRTTHEYEQRIYCLQSHYSDVVERMEARAQKDADHIRQLEEQLCELRKANTELCAKEADLTKKVQQYKNTKRAANSQSVATKPAPPASSFTLANQANVSKKLIEFMEHCQDDVRRLKQETNTAQEWVITLAELVVGPKKERQTWDEWLNSCLDTLQKRRERMKEEEWLKKIGWCPKNGAIMKSKQ
ncbi:hypothetical protein EV178_001066 [Coemansia sp. RSA 1646]|nr:hypothetical protein EV178_001066 [Coemansia sp. RSA 1646]